MAQKTPTTAQRTFWTALFGLLTGIFFAVLLLKFGNPVILGQFIESPSGIYEIIFQPWPMTWALVFPALLTASGLKAGRWKIPSTRWFQLVFILPLIWLAWQFVSATQSVDANLTRLTLIHFTASVICFYIGWFCLNEIKNWRPVLMPLLAGFVLVLYFGLQQHFGGLEETRQFFYQLPNWRDFPPDFLKKIGSNRIYSTLFYPNTLAAAILLFFPFSVLATWQLSSRFTPVARGSLVAVLSLGAFGNLFWSGSKAGWLLALLLGLVTLLQLSFSPSLKRWIILGLVILGIGGFAIKYAGFFKKGATSVVARLDYWRAAWEITKDNPLLGSGPGTFLQPYQKIKKPQAEFARLCHNDYLEQASDSGIPGFLTFSAFIFLAVMLSRPRFDRLNPLTFCVWLGVLGVSLHALVEFNFYIPALAWPAFLFLGWLCRVAETNRQASSTKVASACF